MAQANQGAASAGRTTMVTNPCSSSTVRWRQLMAERGPCYNCVGQLAIGGVCMDIGSFEQSLGNDGPPEGLSNALQAL